MPIWNKQLSLWNWTTVPLALDGYPEAVPDLIKLGGALIDSSQCGAPGTHVRSRSMSTSEFPHASVTPEGEIAPANESSHGEPHRRKPPQRVTAEECADPLLTVDDVARRLNVSRDWVWDHSSRKSPQLPVIRMGDGALRYRASRIEAFIDERERLSAMRRRA
jgi:predicted DNA-binding transcriptional regulator AlpA